MIRYSEFKFPYQFFHLNFDYQPTGYFKSLDWDYLCLCINEISSEMSVAVHALVMMDTHVHVLFRIANSKENFFAANVFKKLKLPTSDENNVEPIRHQTQYFNTYRYIYRNPVTAGIVANCEDYTYSSLSGLLGKSILRLNVYDQMGLIQNPVKLIQWLNSSNSKLQSTTFDKSPFGKNDLSKAVPKENKVYF